MLKLSASIAALAFITACSTTGTMSGSGASSTSAMGAGPTYDAVGSDPAADTIYLPGPN